VGTSSPAERQFGWGLGYIDDLVLRDRDATGSGTLNERMYALQDANFNVTALADSTGAVQERYGYDAYGLSTVLTPGFGDRTSSLYAWEVRYGGYRWDGECGLYQVRHRGFHAALGGWLQRDPLGPVAGSNLYEYCKGRPIALVDPAGLFSPPFYEPPFSRPMPQMIAPAPPMLGGFGLGAGSTSPINPAYVLLTRPKPLVRPWGLGVLGFAGGGAGDRFWLRRCRPEHRRERRRDC
jgi:RHS repeat-associated protein